MGDKVAAKQLARKVDVPVVPGIALEGDDARVLDQARAFFAQLGGPILVKAAHGGGGCGMCVVREEQDLELALASARSEAKSAFGSVAVFLEKVRHIEVQLLGDLHGNLVHLYERDCSVQRRHQKVIEIAPPPNLSAALRGAICEAAVRLAREARYWASRPTASRGPARRSAQGPAARGGAALVEHAAVGFGHAPARAVPEGGAPAHPRGRHLQRALPSRNYFYGMEVGQEIWVDLEAGKTLVISLSAVGEPDDDGCRTVYFALNGHNRSVQVRDRSLTAKVDARRQADRGNPNHVAASMPGTVIALHVKPGVHVEAGAPLVTLEAMNAGGDEDGNGGPRPARGHRGGGGARAQGRRAGRRPAGGAAIGRHRRLGSGPRVPPHEEGV